MKILNLNGVGVQHFDSRQTKQTKNAVFHKPISFGQAKAPQKAGLWDVVSGLAKRVWSQSTAFLSFVPILKTLVPQQESTPEFPPSSNLPKRSVVEQYLQLPGDLRKLPELGAAEGKAIAERLSQIQFPVTDPKNKAYIEKLPGIRGQVYVKTLSKAVATVSDAIHQYAREQGKAGASPALVFTYQGDVLDHGEVAISAARLIHKIQEGCDVSGDTAANLKLWICQAAKHVSESDTQNRDAFFHGIQLQSPQNYRIPLLVSK